MGPWAPTAPREPPPPPSPAAGFPVPTAGLRVPSRRAQRGPFCVLLPAPLAPDSGCHACVPLGRLLITAGVLE